VILYHVTAAGQAGDVHPETLLVAGVLAIGSILVGLSASARRRRREVPVEVSTRPGRGVTKADAHR